MYKVTTVFALILNLSMLTPRNTWAYGKDLLDAVYNVETVYLHQNDVINNGREDCHHLTVGVVGAGGAGKTSLIRKLTGNRSIHFN